VERIAVTGLTLHEADVQALERISSPARSGGAAFLRDLADELAASELVLIATCNRVEVVFAREVGHLPSCPRATRCARGCTSTPGATPCGTCSA
jgi:glutamyl-tRNA reductase